MFMKMSSGGEEESAAGATEATVAVAGTSAVGTATGATPGEAVESAVTSALESTGEAVGGTASLASVPAPPPPAPVAAAYDSNKTVVLLIVHNGGIDDKLVKQATEQLASSPGVSFFTVPAKQIARYAAITLVLQINRVPALVVMRPKRLSKGTPQASVDYGFQTAQGVAQAVRDANYKGRELSYHPN